MEYNCLVDTYDSERLKTLNVWSMFTDDDLAIRPHPALQKDRNALEHMIHQCLGEINSLIEGETQGGRKATLPGPGDKPSTERP